MNGHLVSISLSSDVEQLLADNEVDLFTELQRQGLDIAPGESAMPDRTPSGHKSVELVILASAAAAPLIASGVARVIDAIGRYRAAITPSASKDISSSHSAVSEHGAKVSLLGLKVELTDKYT